MIMKVFNFVSPLTREECLRRLRAKVGQEPLTWSVQVGGFPIASNSSGTGTDRVVGKIGESEIRLHKQIEGGNSFRTYLFGRLTDDGKQTRLRCRVGMHPAIIAFMILWMGLAVGFGLYGIADGSALLTINLPLFPISYEGLWVAIVMPLILVAGGVAVVTICRFLARDEEKFLLDFVRTTLDAEETGVQAGAV